MHDAAANLFAAGVLVSGATVSGFGGLGKSRSSGQKGEKRSRRNEFSPAGDSPSKRPAFGSFRLPASREPCGKQGTPPLDSGRDTRRTALGNSVLPLNHAGEAPKAAPAAQAFATNSRLAADSGANAGSGISARAGSHARSESQAAGRVVIS